MEEKIKRYNILFIILIALAVITAYAFFAAANTINKMYYIGFLGVFPFIILSINVYKKMAELKTLMKLRNDWGKVNDRKRNFNEIIRLFQYIKNEGKNKFFIDDQTWEDLNMKDIYGLLDRTLTTPGEQMLYNILREPLMDKNPLIKRSNAIKLFQNNKDAREKAQMALSILGRQKGSLITSFLWEELPSPPKYKFMFPIMGIIAAASAVSVFFLGIKSLYIIFPVFAINLSIHYKVKNIIEGQLLSVSYINEMIRVAFIISDIKETAINDYGEVLKRAATNSKGILKKNRSLVLNNLNELGQYFSIFFLMEVRSFFSSLDEIIAHKEELKEIYLKLGEVDTLVSIASYREGIKTYSEPKLNKNGAEIEIIGAVHPLLEKPVSNSINIKDEGIVITGSNMSGKSTFLRTLGVNALFAQTIYTCTAEEYSGSFFKIMTSISQGDNLIGGKSYYLAEAESLLRIIKASGTETPVFCIIDEIFRGTNPIERSGASAEILRYLMTHNTITVVATHDIEITEMVKDLFDFYYFSEDIGEKGLHFDYIIKQGVSKNRNAVKLMKYLGYPDKIVEDTTKRVESMIS